MAELLQYRFPGDEADALGGHTIGNLLLAARQPPAAAGLSGLVERSLNGRRIVAGAIGFRAGGQDGHRKHDLQYIIPQVGY